MASQSPSDLARKLFSSIKPDKLAPIYFIYGVESYLLDRAIDAIIKAALRRPFGSRRVLTLIHWQALKLWFKGATFRSQPAPPADDVSR